MNLTSFIAALLVALCAMAASSGAEDSSLDAEVERYLEATGIEDRPMRVHWKNGVRFSSPDDNFEFDINARALVDLIWRGSDDFPADDTPNEVDFRAARLGVSGHVYSNVVYKLQIEFSDGNPEPKDVYVGLRNLGPGLQFLAGHLKEPFGLEYLTSSAQMLFMERSAATNAFAPGLNLGLLLSNNKEIHFIERTRAPKLVGNTRVTFAVGVFRTADRDAVADSEESSVTARLAWMIHRDANSHHLVHTALAYSYRGDHTLRYKDGSGFVDTGEMSVASSQRLALEFVWIAGGFTLAMEYFVTADAQIDGPDTSFHGGYAKIGYWITGEDQGWRVDRIVATVPRRNFHDGTDGMGAFWIGYRFGSLDLDDGAIQGGSEYVHTLGCIWRWNNVTRVMANYAFQDVHDGPLGSGDIHVLAFRIQFAF